MLKIDLDALRDEWESRPHGERRRFLIQRATELGVSVDTLYRRFRQRAGKKKTLVRNKHVGQELIDMIADLKIKSSELGLGDRELSTALCIDELQSRGIPGADLLQVSTVNRRLVESGFRDKEPRIRLEAEFANQEHTIDFSRSKYFTVASFDHSKGDYLLKTNGLSLAYKESGARLRLWIVQIVDRFSRLKLSRAYGATGETGLLGLEFLNFVYNRPEDDHPLRYIPTTLKSDNGAFIKKREVRSALEALKINRSLSRPYAKDSQGVIERRFRTLWQQFELPLAMKIKELGGTIHLGDFNDLMHEYCTSQQVLEHPTMKGQRRGDLYRQSILSYPPREIDISLLEVACKVYERKVNQDLIIRFNGDEYEAPAYCVGKFIRIHKNMEGELIGELIEEDRKPFILKPFRYRKLGDFEHRPAATYRQKRTRILKGQESTPPKKNNQPAGNRHFFEPSPDTVETDSPFTREDVSGTKFPSVFAAKAYIGKQLSPAHTYNDFAFVFDELLETTLDRVEIDQVLNEITEPQNTLKINGV